MSDVQTPTDIWEKLRKSGLTSTMVMDLWISEQVRLLKDKIDGSRTMKLKKDDNCQRNCPKDRHSRRTQRRKYAVWCSVYNCFCIVLPLYVYLYTQFQNPPYLVECWISLKFTDKTIKNFNLQWESNPLQCVVTWEI